VSAAFVIESPNSDAMTVIYLLSKAARCVDLSFSDWVDTIESGTSVLELEVFSKAPCIFLVVATPTPSWHQATAALSRTSARGTSNEARSTGGWVDSASNRGLAAGRFDLTFVTGRLVGKFNAAFCPNGHEP
jgi:hypothetical protein